MRRKTGYVLAMSLLAGISLAQEPKPGLPAASPNQSGNPTTPGAPQPATPTSATNPPTTPPQDPTAVTSPQPAPAPNEKASPPPTSTLKPNPATAAPLKSDGKTPSESDSVESLNTGGLTSAQLQQKIETALRKEPTLSGSNLTVVVTGDAIAISGSVGSAKERTTASRIAQSFGENRKLKDTMTVGGAKAAPGKTP